MWVIYYYYYLRHSCCAFHLVTPKVKWAIESFLWQSRWLLLVMGASQFSAVLGKRQVSFLSGAAVHVPERACGSDWKGNLQEGSRSRCQICPSALLLSCTPASSPSLPLAAVPVFTVECTLAYLLLPDELE